MTLRRGALVLGSCAAALQAAWAEPCAPRAALDGDADAIARVSAELARLGITVEQGSTRDTRCPRIVAAVELEPSGGIAVAVRDGNNRSEGRVVSDAALAAAWIDSWIHDDFAVAPATAAVDFAPPSASPGAMRAGAAVDHVDSPARSSILDRYAFEASYVDTFLFDDTTASGISAAACAKLGPFCIGARFAYTTQTFGYNFTAASRADASLLATASWSVELGRMSVVPEIGLGVGRLAVDRLDGCPPPPGGGSGSGSGSACDPMDPTCAAPSTCKDPAGTGSGSGVVYVGDHFHIASYTPRLSATLRIAIPLFEHVWLDGIASVQLAPLGHTDPYPGSSTDPNLGPPATAMPGDPRGSTQLGIGLRVGVP